MTKYLQIISLVSMLFTLPDKLIACDKCCHLKELGTKLSEEKITSAEEMRKFLAEHVVMPGELTRIIESLVNERNLRKPNFLNLMSHYEQTSDGFENHFEGPISFSTSSFIQADKLVVSIQNIRFLDSETGRVSNAGANLSKSHHLARSIWLSHFILSLMVKIYGEVTAHPEIRKVKVLFHAVHFPKPEEGQLHVSWSPEFFETSLGARKVSEHPTIPSYALDIQINR